MREQKLLGELAHPNDAPLPSAIEAVRRLAGASGVKLTAPDVGAGSVVQPAFAHATPTATATPAPPRSSGSGAWLFLVPVAGFAAIALLARRRARTS